MRHFLIPALLAITAVNAAAATHSFDVVIYGGTAGGIIAAVSAAREGLTAAVLEPTNHVGGMVSSGLGATDFGKKEAIGGYAYEFYYRVGRYYRMNQYSADVAWYHEPHLAEQIFREMMSSAGVKVFERARLREQGGVRKEGTRVVSLDTEAGDTYNAKIFIDPAMRAISWLRRV